ncbi:MAG: hypothetical protein ACTSQI_02855 [Candidatus Helarchaeota archaeon]
MSDIHKFNFKGIEYIALRTREQEYLFSFNPQTQQLSLFKGPGLSAKFSDLLSCEFDGCVECSLTISITDAITKDNNEIFELGISKDEANAIIQQINIELQEQFPFF